MRLIINEKKNNYFDTELNSILNNIDRKKIILFNYEHSLLTPNRQYNDAVKRFISDFKELLDYTDFTTDINNIEHWNYVNKKHSSLIASLMAYIDVTYSIMKSFYAKSRGNDKITFNNKWLKNINSYAITDYENSIRPYKKIFSDINNKIKHENREISQVSCNRECAEKISIISNGFFIVGCDVDGAIMPESSIHKEWNNKCVGISYSKNIRDILFCFYVVSYFCSKTIKRIILKEYNEKINMSKYESIFNKDLEDIINRVSKLNAVYFPNEYDEKLKSIEVINKVVFLDESLYKYKFASSYKVSFRVRIDEAKKLKILYKS